MSRLSLVCLTVLVLAQVLQAHAGAFINTWTYPTYNCMGTATLTSSAAANQCNNNTQYLPSWAGSTTQYCVADGQAPATVYFTDGMCVTPMVVVPASLGPSSSGVCSPSYTSPSNSTMMTCNQTASMPLPSAWTPPIAGWISAMQCSNTTEVNTGSSTSPFWQTGAALNSCPNTASAGIACATVSAKPTGCIKDTSAPTGVTRYTNQFACTADSTMNGAYYFSDAACNTLLAADLNPVGCANNGGTTSCSGAPTQAFSYPMTALVQYQESNSVSSQQASCNGPVTGILFFNGPSVCFKGQMFSCNTTGTTTTATLTTYVGQDCTGAITSSTTQSPPAYDSSSSTACDTSSGTGVKYTCAYTAPKLGAASSTSVSAIVMAFSVLVALVARKL